MKYLYWNPDTRTYYRKEWSGRDWIYCGWGYVNHLGVSRYCRYPYPEEAQLPCENVTTTSVVA